MPIRIGCVGSGIVVEDVHFPLISQLKAYEITGIYDISRERADRVAGKFGGVIYPTYRKMLESPAIDVILVTSPSNTHAKYTIEALEAGKHVIVDKPTATKLSDAEKMYETAKRKKLSLVTFQNRRWDPDFVTVRNMVKKNKLGQVFYIESNMQFWGYGSYGYFKKWRTMKRYGGGQLGDWGPHLIDQLILMTGSSIESVWADLQSLVWSDEVDDHCILVLRFKNGTVAKINATGAICHSGFRWFVCGTKGVLHQDGPWGKPMSFSSPEGETVKTVEVSEVETGWVEFYKQYAKAFQGKAEFPVLPEESIRIMRVIEAARKSAKTGQSVKIRKW